ncbi:hypothetical protein [Streptomyces sp. NPDC048473]|uniref:hypothetical protein n=1 Tax=unclassified Streptomyces TaxID=2593676 RepID=UPI00371E4AF8
MRYHLVPGWLGEHTDVDDFAPAPGTPWQDALRGLVTDHLNAHRGLVPLLTSNTVTAPDITRCYRAIATILRDAGYPTNTSSTPSRPSTDSPSGQPSTSPRPNTCGISNTSPTVPCATPRTPPQAGADVPASCLVR